MDYIDTFVKARIKEGKLYLPDVYEFIKSRFMIPVRTFQWYVQEGLLPEPIDEGRTRYYPEELATQVLEKVRLLKALKEYSVIKFSVIKTIFEKYEKESPALIDLLSTAIENYPVFERGRIPDEPVFSWDNSEIMKELCNKLSRGEELGSIKVLNIEKGISTEG